MHVRGGLNVDNHDLHDNNDLRLRHHLGLDVYFYANSGAYVAVKFRSLGLHGSWITVHGSLVSETRVRLNLRAIWKYISNASAIHSRPRYFICRKLRTPNRPGARSGVLHIPRSPVVNASDHDNPACIHRHPLWLGGDSPRPSNDDHQHSNPANNCDSTSGR